MSLLLLIRADGNAQMGTGHVMRCISLAQGWRRGGGSVVFVLAESTPALERRIRGDNFPVVRIACKPGTREDANDTIILAKQHGADWVIVDGYQFSSDYQRMIMEAGLRMLTLDDYGHAGHYYANFVLNQNLSARQIWYENREPYTQLLLGAHYILLREQFLGFGNWRREIVPAARKVLVTLGGADGDNVTGQVIEALRGLDVDVRVVVGGSNPNLEQLKAQVSGLDYHISLVEDCQDMPALMVWADVAIAAGGSTSWELSFMGLPALVIVLADNQVEIAAALEREGVSANLGRHTVISTENITSALQSLCGDQPRREIMSRRGRMLVDGSGVGRIVDLLTANVEHAQKRD